MLWVLYNSVLVSF